MTCVGLLALAIGRVLKGVSSTESSPGKPSSARSEVLDNRRTIKGLANLYQSVGLPTGQMGERSPSHGPYFQGYFLWSVERVAMLYNLPTLADKEWYRWGAEILIADQNPRGDFPEYISGLYTPTTATSFALLFLKRSHPMKDLPPKVLLNPEELNEGIARLVPKGEGSDRSTVSPGQSRKRERSITTSPGQSRNPNR